MMRGGRGSRPRARRSPGTPPGSAAIAKRGALALAGEIPPLCRRAPCPLPGASAASDDRFGKTTAPAGNAFPKHWSEGALGTTNDQDACGGSSPSCACGRRHTCSAQGSRKGGRTASRLSSRRSQGGAMRDLPHSPPAPSPVAGNPAARCARYGHSIATAIIAPWGKPRPERGCYARHGYSITTAIIAPWGKPRPERGCYARHGYSIATAIISSLVALISLAPRPVYAYNCVNVVLRDPYWGQ